MASAYPYVGPPELLERHAGSTGGMIVRGPEDLQAWEDAGEQPRQPDGTTPATYVLDVRGRVRVSARETEHVMCAQGADVLAAGELFLRDGRVDGVTNQSTGYCPGVESWIPLRDALDALGIEHPGGFTAVFDLRVCPACAAVNLVKDGWLRCEVCGAPLPSG